MSRIHEMIPSQRPRERLLGYGASALSDAELIALLLRVGRQGKGVVSEAHLLLSEVGGLAELARMDSRELMRRPGLGPAKVAALLAAFELGRRSAGVELRTAERLDRPEVAGAFLARRVMGERHEVFGIVALDARHRYLSLRFLTRGTRNQAPVDPADVFRSALLDHAAGVLAFHNHPSGDMEPSVDDLALTRRLSRAGESVGVALLDHLIVAGARWVSLRTARPELFTSTSM